MSKDSRSGGKFSGNHTTLVPVAALIADIAHDCPFSTNISPGFITSGLRPVGGRRRVKITDDGSSILLSVRDNTSCQEIHVHSKNLHETKLFIAKGARNAGLQISFGKGKNDL